MKLQFGQGKILIQRDMDGKKVCLLDSGVEDRLGSKHENFPESESDVILEFSNLESLRGLADNLNLMAAMWSHEEYTR